jgi:hypothetical protein
VLSLTFSVSQRRPDLKPSKFILFQKSVNFFRHVLSEEGIHTDPDKIEAVQNWPTHRSIKEIKGALGI